MNLSDIVGHKQAPKDSGPLVKRTDFNSPLDEKTGFMNMRKLQPTERLASQASDGAEYERGIDNLIQGLVGLLPKRGGTWPLEDRAKWLRLAAGIFDLGYKERDGAHSQEISIAVVKQEAANHPISPSMARSAVREQSIPTN